MNTHAIYYVGAPYADGELGHEISQHPSYESALTAFGRHHGNHNYTIYPLNAAGQPVYGGMIGMHPDTGEILTHDDNGQVIDIRSAGTGG